MRLALIVLLATVPRVHAEPCSDEEELAAAITALERFAKDASAKVDASYLDRCESDLVDPDVPRPKLAAIVLKTCTKILARDRAHPICIRAATRLGKKGIAGVDFFTELRAWEHDPWKGGARVLPLYTILANKDAVIRVLEVWNASTDEAAQREKTLEGWQRKHARLQWSEWRQQAAAVLGALGKPDVTPFLTEQAQTTDGAVARACLDAIREIERRRMKALQQ